MHSALVGVWTLVEFKIELKDGTVVHPFGVDARGVLTYTEQGWMSGVLSASDRPHLSVDRLESFGRAPEAEKAAAFDSFLSYAGHYSFDGETVQHNVEVASVPNIVGLDQMRVVEFDQGELTLSYWVTDDERGDRHYSLRWRRAS